jgi:demethylmenaquinone methyltransferase/2-methoxy-6-polyprenyl-1,4-benzoquinol methylase
MFDKPVPSFPLATRPDEKAALRQYRWRSTVYDAELAWFEPLRREAISLLALQPGQRVLDVGCGTGLSFEPLKQALGHHGAIVGIEQCPEMLAQAEARVRAHHWQHIELVNAPAAQARINGLADAALFHFTHDILRQPSAVCHVLQHLRPGARVVATGLQWASPWAWPVNLFVWGAALYSVSTLEGLDDPWSCLAQALPDLAVQPTWMPGVAMATGVWQGQAGAAEESYR